MITITDIAYVRYRAPDLDRIERFLLDFGLHRYARTATHLYMRAAGTEPYVHVTELADSSIGIGLGLLAQSEADLQKLAEKFNVPVRDNLEPRGGRVVTLQDPNGMQVDVLSDGKTLEPLPVREPVKLNFNQQHRRLNAVQRLSVQPSAVVRLGHAVLRVSDYRAAYDFYTSVLGFKPSDIYYADDPAQPVVGFLHCGLGQRYTDHHTVAIVQLPGGGFEHTAFEVVDWDDVATGHQHLKNRGYTHSWGIGRHIEGSQVFDYWRDPFGNKVEHWTDGDQVNDDYVTGYEKFDPAHLSQWSPPVTAEFLS